MGFKDFPHQRFLVFSCLFWSTLLGVNMSSYTECLIHNTQCFILHDDLSHGQKVFSGHMHAMVTVSQSDVELLRT